MWEHVYQLGCGNPVGTHSAQIFHQGFLEAGGIDEVGDSGVFQPGG